MSVDHLTATTYNEIDDIGIPIKKRGRKPISTNYFDVEEENAVRMFLVAQTREEKNEIYNEFLKKPLDKMIESIIRRYKLYPKGMDFREIHHDTHSFLITKVDKFRPSRNKKAYSYFGTICKNYLIGKIIKEQRETNRQIPYEDITTELEKMPDMIYYLENEKLETEKIISEFSATVTELIKEDSLNPNEIRLGLGIIELFENHNEIFIGTDNNKFNKNVVLLSLREMTNMSTKEIRSSMKKFKKIYFEVLNKLVSS